MTDAQMIAYLKAAAACENKMIGAVLTFELLTGMRFGEVRKLSWDDVDLQRNVVHVRDPKGGKDQFLPLNPAAVDLLNQLPRDPDSPFVFQGGKRKNKKTGLMEVGRIGSSTAARYGRKFALAAGLPADFRPNHGLRHSYASALASSGEVDMYVLQKLLTHKSPQMTQRYAHLRDETLRRGADVMSQDRQFGGGSRAEEGRDGVTRLPGIRHSSTDEGGQGRTSCSRFPRTNSSRDRRQEAATMNLKRSSSGSAKRSIDPSGQPLAQKRVGMKDTPRENS